MCIGLLKSVIYMLSDPGGTKDRLTSQQVNDELERFSLWMGNIGALNPPESSMSLDFRLRDAEDIHAHILGLINDLLEVATERKSEVPSSVVRYAE